MISTITKQEQMKKMTAEQLRFIIRDCQEAQKCIGGEKYADEMLYAAQELKNRSVK